MSIMSEETIEAIVLRSFDYQEKHRIVTLFSSEGILSLIIKNISKNKAHLLSLSSPFSHGEYLFRRGRSDLFHFIDGSLIDENLDLRKRFSSLQIAGALTNALLSSLMPEKKSPALFSLYKSYLKQIPLFSNPTILLSSFYLKLLRHEGHLLLTPQCNRCPSETASILDQGESLCLRHASQSPYQFTNKEWNDLSTLLFARTFTELSTLAFNHSLASKVSDLFNSYLSI